MRPAILPAPLLIGLAACATAPSPPEMPVRMGAEGQCDVTEVQAIVGSKATSEVGAQLLQVSGARTLRWVPPRTAVTMDFRPDRLTVAYSDDMIIERISCG